LPDKKANVFADIPPLKLKSTDIIKSLTGYTDKISGEQKFKDTFEFVNGAKLIFSANQLPGVDDESDAFWNRVILIEFPHKFEGKKDDKELIKKLTTPEDPWRMTLEKLGKISMGMFKVLDI
jgi:putative DNA primase/helicase